MTIERSISTLGRTAVVVVALIVSSAGGCVQTFDARFDPSSDGLVFGTLIDDRGSFEFIRDPETGNLQRAEANNGTITFPTDGQDFAVSRDTGGSLTLQPEGNADVLVVVRGDPVLGDVEFQVARESLGELGDVVREAAGTTEDLCGGNQDFLDAACVPINSIDVDELVDMIRADLLERGSDPPPESAFRATINRYLSVPIDCCLAWDEFRSNNGDACAG